ncbi:MAG: phosphohistidine phosphatase SixA [Pseudomonadota bacterium]
MKLYLVQHGDALPQDIDPDRPLSDKGRNDIRRLAEFLAGRPIRAQHVVHSGKTRARQTAELLAAALAPGANVEARSGLDPNDPTEPLAASVSLWDQDALVIGHLPFLGKFVARLVGVREDPIVAYHPGTLVGLERGKDGRWTIAFVLPPELVS